MAGTVALAVALSCARALAARPESAGGVAPHRARPLVPGRRDRPSAALLQGVFDDTATADLPESDENGGSVETGPALVRGAGNFQDEESPASAAAAATVRRQALDVAALSPLPGRPGPPPPYKGPPPRSTQPLVEAVPLPPSEREGPDAFEREVNAAQADADREEAAGETGALLDGGEQADPKEAEAITLQDEDLFGVRPPLATAPPDSDGDAVGKAASKPALAATSKRLRNGTGGSARGPAQAHRPAGRPRAALTTASRHLFAARRLAAQAREQPSAPSIHAQIAKSFMKGDAPASTSARTRPKGWDQCLRFTRNLKAKGITGTELVKVWRGTCMPAVQAGQATERFKLMCNSLSGALDPYAAQIDYNVNDLCESVLAVFHDVSAVDSKPVR